MNPIFMMSITAVVFSSLFKQDLKTFAIFLFSGMIPWNCYSSIVVQSGTSFIHNEGLIKKIYLPKIIFPLSSTLGLLIDSLLSFVALFLIMLALGSQLSWSLLFVPLGFVLLFLFSLGIAFVVSVSTVYFRDLQHVIGIIMQAWFFLTPVFYKNNAIAGKVAWLIRLNPVTYYVELFRDPMYMARFPEINVIATTLVMSMLSIVIGWAFFLYHEKKIVFRL